MRNAASNSGADFSVKLSVFAVELAVSVVFVGADFDVVVAFGFGVTLSDFLADDFAGVAFFEAELDFVLSSFLPGMIQTLTIGMQRVFVNSIKFALMSHEQTFDIEFFIFVMLVEALLPEPIRSGVYV